MGFEVGGWGWGWRWRLGLEVRGKVRLKLRLRLRLRLRAIPAVPQRRRSVVVPERGSLRLG